MIKNYAPQPYDGTTALPQYVTEQMEWVRRKNSIHNRAEEIVLTELVYAL